MILHFIPVLLDQVQAEIIAGYSQSALRVQ
jgi:hypothetical protein